MDIQFNGLKDPILIQPYNTSQEKDMLLSAEFNAGADSDFIISDLLRTCNVKNIDQLTLDEKRAVLYKLREVSVGEVIEINMKCPHCGTPQTVDINISEIVKPRSYDTSLVKDLHRLPNDEDDFMTNFLTDDNIEIDEYEELFKRVKETQTLLDFSTITRCLMCKKDVSVNLKRDDFVVKMISEDSLKSLYKTYDTLIYYGHWNKCDIDTLLPFERKIFITLLQQTIEKQSQKNKSV